MSSKYDSIKLYLKEVSKIPMIPKDEMKELIPKIKRGEREARDRLIKGNLRLVISVAKKFQRSGVELNDLIEAGNMGLIAAANKYDPDKGAKFSTYAHDWIKEYIRRAVLGHTKPIHIPVYVYQNFQKIMRAWDALFKKEGRQPKNEELAEATGFKEKDVKKFLHYIKIFSEIPSLDAPISSDIDIPLKATLAATDQNTPEDALGIIAMHQQIDNLMKNITERENKVIRLRFGVGATHPHTLQDVGEKLNISRERVRQIQNKALNKLKKAAIAQKKKDAERMKEEIAQNVGRNH